MGLIIEVVCRVIIPFRVINFRVENHNALLGKYFPRTKVHFFMRIGITGGKGSDNGMENQSVDT